MSFAKTNTWIRTYSGWDWLYLNETEPLLDRYDREFRDQVKRLAATSPIPTPIMQELPPEKRRTTHLFERGNWLVKGPEVEAGIPSGLRTLPPTIPGPVSYGPWLADSRHPLTARVAVNRFWEQLFGFGIVETVEDLGTPGQLAHSIPLLLDWLAVQFAGDWQWSIKRLLRELVLSASLPAKPPCHSGKTGERPPQSVAVERPPTPGSALSKCGIRSWPSATC